MTALTEENRALIQQDLGQSYWEPDDGYVWLGSATDGDLNRLMNAAREQGRSHLPAVDGGEPVAWLVRDFADGEFCTTDKDSITSYLRNNHHVTPLCPHPAGAVSEEEIAEIIWHRFAPAYETEFREDSSKAEYLKCARAILSRLTRRVSGPPPSGGGS